MFGAISSLIPVFVILIPFGITLFNPNEWLIGLPFVIVIILFCYYVLKEIFQKVFFSITLSDTGFELMRFFNKIPIIIKYQDIISVQFIGDYSLRFILGFGGSTNSNYHNSSFNEDRKRGGRSFRIKIQNRMPIEIYEFQFSESEYIFQEIIEGCRSLKQ